MAAPEPLQSPAAVPAATKPEMHAGDLPAQPLPAPSAVPATAAVPAAMAGPGTLPAALQESFVPTSEIIQGDVPSSAADSQVLRHHSLCTISEGISSSGGAEADPPPAQRR